MYIRPSASSPSADVVDNIASNYSNATTFGYLRSVGNLNIVLDQNGNDSLTLEVGNSSDTSADFVAGVGSGAFTITAAGGLDNLGTGERLIVLGSGNALPYIKNGLAGASPTLDSGTVVAVGPNVFAADVDAYQTQDFVTYLASGGYFAASNTNLQTDNPRGDEYTQVNTFSGTGRDVRRGHQPEHGHGIDRHDAGLRAAHRHAQLVQHAGRERLELRLGARRR